MAIRAYTELIVWQEAMNLAEQCYTATAAMDRDERFGLVAQMRRAAVSVASSIAEGHNRRSPKALRYHLGIALGSLAEYETQMQLCVRLCLTSPETAEPLLEQAARVGQLLSGFRRSVRATKPDRQ